MSIEVSYSKEIALFFFTQDYFQNQNFLTFETDRKENKIKPEKVTKSIQYALIIGTQGRKTETMD